MTTQAQPSSQSQSTPSSPSPVATSPTSASLSAGDSSVCSGLHAALSALSTLANNYGIDESVRQAEVQKKATHLKQQIEHAKRHNHLPSYDYHYLLGCCLFVSHTSPSECLNHLESCVKKSPTSVDLWNKLGELIWRHSKDGVRAKNYLLQALTHGENKDTLQLLSMIVKNTGDGGEKQKNVLESIKYAQSALALDLSDGHSWYVLGNAYLAQYFLISQCVENQEKTLKAYQKAETSSRNPASQNPDLHFNRAHLYAHLELYNEALLGYERAHALDSAIGVTEREDIVQFLSKLQHLLSSFKLNQKTLTSLSTIPSHLSLASRHAVSNFAQLQFGANPKSYVQCKLLYPVIRSASTPCTFVIVDRDGQLCVLSLYNISSELLGRCKKDDDVVVFDGIKRSVSVSVANQQFSFLSIQCFNPLSIWINGKGIAKEAWSNGLEVEFNMIK